MQFRVDNDAVVEHTNRLEKMHKSDFPLAVRGTLNSMAFDVKQNTMPNKAEKEFVNRQKNFFKANSKVEMANGFNVSTMHSKVGFISLSGTNYAVDDLEQQEHGGDIKGRSFIPLDKARVSNSPNRIVSRNNRISKIKNIVKVSEAKGNNDGQKFIKSVVFAGKGGYVLTDNTLIRVDSLSRQSGKWKFKLKALYSFKKKRSVKVKKTEFMKEASEMSAEKGNRFFIEQAERRFSKAGL